MLRQPKLPGGASRCATGNLRMRVVMLREFRVSVLPCHYDLVLHLGISTEFCPLSFRLGAAPLSFRPSGSEWRNLQGARSAKQAHGMGHSVRCADGCGAPGADFGLWRTAVG